VYVFVIEAIRNLLAAFSAPAAAAQSTTAAQPLMRSALAPESGPQALPVEILPQVSSPNPSASAEQRVAHATFDFGVQSKSEPTQQFPFGIQHVAATARR
jgi:hypothetical protein